MFILLVTLFLQADSCVACTAFDMLDKRIRDGQIAENEAVKLLTAHMAAIRKYYQAKNIGSQNTVFFPLQGYDKRAIGENGIGYKPKGYRYLDGNRHKGHPAQDIFIYDKNQDGLDDRTCKSVNVVTMARGIVVAVNPAWEPESTIRGGKYVWIFDVNSNGMYYYAHLGKVTVKPGDLVTAGQVIGTLGRTGANAFKKRSPTHLHVGYFILTDSVPIPRNLYEKLRNAQTR